MHLLIFFAVTAVFMIPFTGAVFYLYMGIRSCMVGKRERNKTKFIGGYNTIAFSLLAMGAVFFFWYVIVRDFLGW